MKPIWALSLILMIAIACFCMAPRSRRQDVETSGTVLHLTEDFERDRSQMPMALTRLPGQSEVLAGGEVAEGCLSAESAHPVDMQIAEEYVSRVGACVASSAHQRLPCRFHLVVKSNLIDAFAFPGGHVS